MSDVACAVFCRTSSGLGFCEVHPAASKSRATANEAIIFTTLRCDQSRRGWSHRASITGSLSRKSLSAPRLVEGENEIDLQFTTTQSAPASLSSASWAVVLHAMTRAPAALPEPIPAGASSTTTQSFGENPRNDAPFR